MIAGIVARGVQDAVGVIVGSSVFVGDGMGVSVSNCSVAAYVSVIAFS